MKICISLWQEVKMADNFTPSAGLNTFSSQLTETASGQKKKNVFNHPALPVFPG
jgi:hypothetical protein